MYTETYIYHNNERYILKNIVARHHFRDTLEEEDINLLKEWALSDIVLAKDGYYHFCKLIPSVDFELIVEESESIDEEE